MSIGILDYGVGNISSIANMLEFLGIDYLFITHPGQFEHFNKIIIPGVGSFDYAMEKIHEKGFYKPILTFAKNNKYIFGICLGLQLLGNKSDEGVSSGLELIDFDVKSLKNNTNIVVPHMGWSNVEKNDFNYTNSNLNRFYFVHSFYVPISDNKQKYETILISEYGVKFSAGIKKNNIYGFQFHPEKSHKYGMELFMYLSSLK